MADKDLGRARALLKSAETLYKEGDLAGVAGLAYQAFESAVIEFNKIVKGKDSASHKSRMETAKDIYAEHIHDLDFLWEMRNIDFYGNKKAGEVEDAGLEKEKIAKVLTTVRDIIIKTEELLEKKKAGQTKL